MRAGLDLVPFSITGESEAVVVGNVGVSGIPVQLVGADKRQQAIREIMNDRPGLIVVDFTLPGAVNGRAASSSIFTNELRATVICICCY